MLKHMSQYALKWTGVRMRLTGAQIEFDGALAHEKLDLKIVSAQQTFVIGICIVLLFATGKK